MSGDIAHRLVGKLAVDRDGEAVRLQVGPSAVTGGPEFLVALDLLCSRAVPRDIVRERPELATAVDRLCGAGLVVPVNHPVTAERPRGFDQPIVQIRMLNDAARTAAYLDAIARVVMPGDVVVDLGTGTGVLAVAAAKAGARRVFAIEAGEVAALAERLAHANGVADRVEVVRGWSTKVDVPERARVLITETVGNEPLGENILEAVLDARRRFLLADALMVPSCLLLGVELVWVPDEPREELRSAAARALTRGGDEAFALEALRELVPAPGFRVNASTASGWPRVADRAPLVTLDLTRQESADVDTTIRVTASRSGRLNGAIVTAQITLPFGRSVSTARWSPENSWSAYVHSVPQLAVEAGDTLLVRYRRGLGGARVAVSR